MFFIASKLLNFILSPVIWIFILLILSIIARDGKRRKRRFIGGLTLFFVCSNSFITNEIVGLWELKAIKNSDLSHFDYGVVLGGMASYDAHLQRINFFGSSDRLLQAMELYKTGKINKILIVSGSGNLFDQTVKEADFLREYLIIIGFPAKDIIIENQSRNTYENARFAANYLNRTPKKPSALLITSAVHLRRSIACFRKAGVEVTPYATDRLTGGRQFNFDQIFRLTEDAIEKWDCLSHEVFGYLMYRIMGYL